MIDLNCMSAGTSPRDRSNIDPSMSASDIRRKPINHDTRVFFGHLFVRGSKFWLKYETFFFCGARNLSKMVVSKNIKIFRVRRRRARNTSIIGRGYWKGSLLIGLLPDYGGRSGSAAPRTPTAIDDFSGRLRWLLVLSSPRTLFPLLSIYVFLWFYFPLLSLNHLIKIINAHRSWHPHRASHVHRASQVHRHRASHKRSRKHLQPVKQPELLYTILLERLIFSWLLSQYGDIHLCWPGEY